MLLCVYEVSGVINIDGKKYGDENDHSRWDGRVSTGEGWSEAGVGWGGLGWAGVGWGGVGWAGVGWGGLGWDGVGSGS